MNAGFDIDPFDQENRYLEFSEAVFLRLIDMCFFRLSFNKGEKVKCDQHQGIKMENGSCINCLQGWISMVRPQVGFDITGCVSSVIAQKIVQRFLYFTGLVSAKTLQKVLHCIPDDKLWKLVRI